ncbi:SDR family NAD(P)-dependent oxidoreductase [Caulobacter segnis]|uniref:SDR family oxidoreductase n=1 Tax=Caulobacter segnis TaxID=88688 RepID=UPI00240FD855|nr:SDR family oxidoreductase [Caulobacter segnis]MDG2520628.1 SDR family NAD(P)-dependent oxidoreductase [Caulobacter segnis]
MTDPKTDVHTAMPALQGKRIVVTGGTTGIGRAIALLLASEGARLFVFGREPEPLADTLAAIKAVGGEGHGVTADVAKPEDVERVFARADEALGGLDILINNAAIWGEALAEMDEWRYSVDTNFTGFLDTARQGAKRLVARGDGHIVLIGSVSAIHRSAGSSVYVAAKSGIQGFAQSFRKELASSGVRVTLIEPGLVGSDLLDSSPEEQVEQINAKKMLRAEDIAVGVHYALTQPTRCNVVAMQIEPLLQEQD